MIDPKVFEAILGSPVAKIFGILVVLVLGKDGAWKMIPMAHEQREKRQDRAERLMGTEIISPDLKNVIKEDTERSVFRGATGIDAEPFRRKLLYEFQRAFSGQFNWRQLAGANRHLVVIGESLVVKIHVMDAMSYWFQIFGATMCFGLGGVGFLSDTIEGRPGDSSTILRTLLASGLIVLGIALLNSTRCYFEARRLGKLLPTGFCLSVCTV